MISIMWLLPFVVLGVCKSASALQFTKYRKHTATIVQNVSESMMMTTVVGCERYYSTMSTRVIVYDITQQLCQLYEENAFPLMILPAPSPSRTFYVKGTVFALVQTLMTWFDAEINCEANGGHLIKIESLEKQELVSSWLSLYSHGSAAWIGLNDRSTEGSFSWADGSSLGNFSFWKPSNPDDYISREDCVQLTGSSHYWNDVYCEFEFLSLCEYI